MDDGHDDIDHLLVYYPALTPQEQADELLHYFSPIIQGMNADTLLHVIVGKRIGRQLSDVCN